MSSQTHHRKPLRKIRQPVPGTPPGFARVIILFILRSGALFALLIAPWPSSTDLYAAYLRSLGNLVFQDSSPIIRFLPTSGTYVQRFDTQIVLADPSQAHSNGIVPARFVQLPSRAIGWIPTALTIALVLGTGGAWKRRTVALAIALALINGFIILTLGVLILHHANQADTVRLVSLSPWITKVVSALHEALVIHVGAGLLVAVPIWILTSGGQLADYACLRGANAPGCKRSDRDDRRSRETYYASERRENSRVMKGRLKARRPRKFKRSPAMRSPTDLRSNGLPTKKLFFECAHD